MEKNRIVYFVLFLVLIIYIFRPRDFCKEGRLEYNLAEVNMKIVKISDVARGMYFEGYDSVGHYFRWQDPGNLTFINSDKIQVGDSLTKLKTDSIFCLKKVDGSVTRFYFECGN